MKHKVVVRQGMTIEVEDAEYLDLKRQDMIAEDLGEVDGSDGSTATGDGSPALPTNETGSASGESNAASSASGASNSTESASASGQ